MSKATKAHSKRLVKFALRIPQGLHGRLHKSADRSRRSLNSEILTLLEKALAAEGNK